MSLVVYAVDLCNEIFTYKRFSCEIKGSLFDYKKQNYVSNDLRIMFILRDEHFNIQKQ